MARPRNLSDDRVSELISALEEYIQSTEVPILAEFVYQNEITKDDIYNYDEFYTLRKALIAKKEAQLERLALTGEIDKTVAIFSLKQLGWSDKQQLEHTGPGGKDLNLTVNFVKPEGDDGR